MSVVQNRRPEVAQRVNDDRAGLPDVLAKLKQEAQAWQAAVLHGVQDVVIGHASHAAIGVFTP
jgi:hypothetical protein